MALDTSLFISVLTGGTCSSAGVVGTASLAQPTGINKKIRNEISSNVFFGLESLILSEKTTHGVAGFDRDSSTSESAKSLSLEGHVIVIATDDEIGMINTSARIRVLTSKEFNEKIQEVKGLCSRDEEIPVFFKLVFFKT